MHALLDNKYQYVKLLGQGGFGRVFLAREVRSENLVAIKQLNAETKSRQEHIIREMQMVSKFNHPHIIQYKHNIEYKDTLFFVMEYCALGSLRLMLRNPKTVSAFLWKWMDTLTSTLQVVHQKGIVHHDIKPDNILFTEDRTIKLSDFGIANTSNGTIAYLSPEALSLDYVSVNDVRLDVYALGVTLLEMLTGKNPFLGKSPEEILELHESKSFGIENLPHWQQDIILKAIAKIPEQRFQTMQDFHDAINAKSVPIIFDKEVVLAGNLAERVDRLLSRKKWVKAFALLKYAEENLKPSVSIFLQRGKYHLLARQIEAAKLYFEKALKWNQRLDIQKELGWINLELLNYPTAISLLSDHLHRHPSDYEAYNLLLQCYYETNRYEPVIELAGILLDADPNNHCFANNYYISNVLHNNGHPGVPDAISRVVQFDNHFFHYNQRLTTESERTHNFEEEPTLKSKLLFMDYRFNKYIASTLYCTHSNVKDFKDTEITAPIIKFGRDSFQVNDIKVPGGTAISRRHCVIINYKDDIWIYDLASTGTFINDQPFISKAPLIGRNTITIGQAEYEFTNDKTKLF